MARQSYGYEPNASPIESTHQTLGVVSSDYVPNRPFISPNTRSWSVEDKFVVGTYSTSSMRSRCMSIMGSIRVSTRRFGGVTWREIRERAVVRCATFQRYRTVERSGFDGDRGIREVRRTATTTYQRAGMATQGM